MFDYRNKMHEPIWLQQYLPKEDPNDNEEITIYSSWKGKSVYHDKRLSTLHFTFQNSHHERIEASLMDADEETALDFRVTEPSDEGTHYINYDTSELVLSSTDSYQCLDRTIGEVKTMKVSARVINFYTDRYTKEMRCLAEDDYVHISKPLPNFKPGACYNLFVEHKVKEDQFVATFEEIEEEDSSEEPEPEQKYVSLALELGSITLSQMFIKSQEVSHELLEEMSMDMLNQLHLFSQNYNPKVLSQEGRGHFALKGMVEEAVKLRPYLDKMKEGAELIEKGDLKKAAIILEELKEHPKFAEKAIPLLNKIYFKISESKEEEKLEEKFQEMEIKENISPVEEIKKPPSKDGNCTLF